MPLETEISLIEELKIIKSQIETLEQRKLEIEKFLPEKVIYQNEDATYTRFTRIDNLKELEEKGSIFRASICKRYTCRVENLKNKPKED